MASSPEDTQEQRRAALGELVWLFLRLGVTAFGGPAAHVALMQNEVVRRRQWLTEEEFLDLLGAASLIPGPTSTEMTAYLGRLRGGLPGMIVAEACFILPAALMVCALAWAYVRFGALPQVAGPLYGVKPVVIAVVAQALWGLRRAALKTPFLAILAAVALAASFAGVNVLLVLLGTGALVAAVRAVAEYRPRRALLSVAPVGLLPLFLYFLKVGAVLFGSGYVLLAFLRADLVQHYGWLTEARLLDAIAVGQITPGPVFTTATFIGYLLAGVPGAAVATLGIFLPSFFYVGLTAPLIARVRRSPVAGAFLDGINVAALALMIFVTWQLARAAVVDVPTAVLAAASLAILLAWRVNTTWLILGGAALGLAVKLLAH